MKRLVPAAAVIALAVCASAQGESTSISSIFQNQRLKTLILKDSPISGDINVRVVSGFWVSESKDPARALVLPQQVKLTCTHAVKTCRELIITLAPTAQMVGIQDVDDEEYAVDSWDGHGLVASYGGGEAHSRCQRHVLTMDFDSGAVSVADVPTHKKGCEAFKDTNSYRLIRGSYYVDTTPGNDLDKPKK